MKKCRDCFYFDGCDIVNALSDNDVEVDFDDWKCSDWKRDERHEEGN